MRESIEQMPVQEVIWMAKLGVGIYYDVNRSHPDDITKVWVSPMDDLAWHPWLRGLE